LSIILWKATHLELSSRMRKAEINEVLRVEVVREDVENSGRGGVVSVLAKSDGRFERINGLTRPVAIFV
jgi:hypothetical protein